MAIHAEVRVTVFLSRMNHEQRPDDQKITYTHALYTIYSPTNIESRADADAGTMEGDTDIQYVPWSKEQGEGRGDQVTGRSQTGRRLRFRVREFMTNGILRHGEGLSA